MSYLSKTEISSKKYDAERNICEISIKIKGKQILCIHHIIQKECKVKTIFSVNEWIVIEDIIIGPIKVFTKNSFYSIPPEKLTVNESIRIIVKNTLDVESDVKIHVGTEEFYKNG